ncbi:hypothetical protein L0128_02650 [candidate division KSB1 bacterium]|nr:hypothetical protein [candidate division KSB1 bacterium]
MQAFAQARPSDSIPDLLLFLAHPNCLALGARKLNPADLLRPLAAFEKNGIPLHQSSRSGGLTFHWPGQLRCYPVLKLPPAGQNLPDFMYRLEEVGIRCFRYLGFEVARRREQIAQIGWWYQQQVICRTFKAGL